MDSRLKLFLLLVSVSLLLTLYYFKTDIRLLASFSFNKINIPDIIGDNLTEFIDIASLNELSTITNPFTTKGLNYKYDILCIILTSPNNFLVRSAAVWKTWAKKCGKALFACNCSTITANQLSENNISDIPIMQLNLTENYNLMAGKTLKAIEIAYKQYRGLFKWFLLVDDDTYVLMDNLNKFISNRNYREPVTYGYNFKITVPNGFHSGGAGVLFTYESIERIVRSIDNKACNDTAGFGDIAIGSCSYKSNVTLGNSLDELGRERFHPLSLRAHYKDKLQDWLVTYSSNVPKVGKECCSEESITFHYIPPEEMIKYSYLKNESISNFYDIIT